MFEPSKGEGWMAFMKSGKIKEKERVEDDDNELDPEFESDFEDMLVSFP